MAESPASVTDAKQSRDVAEAAREDGWSRASFLRELFLGRLRMELIDPFPEPDGSETARAAPFLASLRNLLERLDPDAIDRDGAIPESVLAELRSIGAFGIKIPREHGGLGLSLPSYLAAMQLCASRCGNVAALLSAHQSIGLPQPLMMFGTAEQKQRWLPRLAAGAISAFALTEEGAGSDPARLKTTAVPLEDGSWLLDGEKIWCTNSTIAELLVVMARTPDVKGKRQITAFVVEANTPGFEVLHRCSFMGLRALENGVLRFRGVRVPKENVLGAVGKGLKLALTTLNTGRLAVPASCAGAAASMLQATRAWAGTRTQWGAHLGEHEAIAVMVGRMAAETFAMDSVARLAGLLAARADVRLEAALAKLWNAQAAWRIADDALQIRGGRGYETAQSQARRGEAAIGIERVLRDLRVNRIFEGSAEILRLFVAREALDQHLTTAFDVINPEANLRARLEALERSARFYPRWYAETWTPHASFARFGPLEAHAKWLDESVRRLGRSIFHALVRYGPALEKRQAILFQAVDIGADLFAAAATLSRARALMRDEAQPGAVQLADAFLSLVRPRVEERLRDLFEQETDKLTALSRAAIGGELSWLESSAIGLDAPGATARVPRGAHARS